MAIVVYAALGLSWWKSLDWCGLGAWGSLKQVNYGSWTLLESVLGRWRESVNHGTHQPFLLRGSPSNSSFPSPPPFGRVLGLVSIYSSHSFKPQPFFFLCPRVDNLFIVPQCYLSPLQLTAWESQVPFITMSPSFLLFSMWSLYLLLCRSYSISPQFFLRRNCFINKCRLSMSKSS